MLESKIKNLQVLCKTSAQSKKTTYIHPIINYLLQLANGS